MLVRVYRNLAQRCLSVVFPDDHRIWRVGHHADALLLADAEMVVQEHGRFQVLNTGQKNVHAWVTGRLIAADVAAVEEPIVSDTVEEVFPWLPEADVVAEQAVGCTRFDYNPFTARFFFETETMDPIETASFAYIRSPGECFAFGPADLPPVPAVQDLMLAAESQPAA